VDREECDGYNVFTTRPLANLGAQNVVELLYAFIASASQQGQSQTHSIMAKMTQLMNANISWMEKLHEARDLFIEDRGRNSAAISMRAFTHITNFAFDPSKHHLLSWIQYLVNMANSLVL